MSSHPRPQNNKAVSITSEEQVNQFIELQKLKIANEAKDLSLREKDMDHQSKYAHKLLDIQGQIERDRPKENRKTITRLAYIAGALIIVMMVFSGFCLYFNKDEFLLTLIKIIGYFATTWLGYHFGKKEGKTSAKSQGSLNNTVEDILD
jgi:hypothetical protein